MRKPSTNSMGWALSMFTPTLQQCAADPQNRKATPDEVALVASFSVKIASSWKEHQCFTWHRPIFSGGYPPNIVGAAAFHSRVRDGSEWFHYAMDTRIVIIDGLHSQVNPENCIGSRTSA